MLTHGSTNGASFIEKMRLYTIEFIGWNSWRPQKGADAVKYQIILTRQSKLVGLIHAYRLIIRSDPNTKGKLGLGALFRTPGGACRRRARRRPGHLALGGSDGPTSRWLVSRCWGHWGARANGRVFGLQHHAFTLALGALTLGSMREWTAGLGWPSLVHTCARGNHVPNKKKCLVGNTSEGITVSGPVRFFVVVYFILRVRKA